MIAAGRLYNDTVLTAWDLQAVTGPRPTGLGYSVRLLLDAYCQFGADGDSPAEVAGLRPNLCERGLRGVPDRLLWEQWRLPQALAAARPRPELLYSPALGVPRNTPIARVAHVHDLIPLIDPAQFRGLSRWYWTAYLPQGWRRCAALTVSNESLVADVAQRLDFPAARIYVVPYYCSLSAGDVAAALATPRPVSAPYFMTLASHEPRKNLVLVLNALALLAERGLRPAVVCVGSRTAHSLPLRQLAQRLGVGAQVTWPDYVPRSLVLQLLRHAVALLFVSRYEGYGMPPQEAQVLGTPVVLSDIASHRSVYGDAHRWAEVEPELQSPPPFVGIDDVTALADKMERLMRDPSWGLQLAAAGRAYQRSFSPQETGKALRAAFQQALGV